MGRSKGDYAQTERVLRIRELLQQYRHGVSVDELARRFLMHAKTIKRDLEVLGRVEKDLRVDHDDDGKPLYRLDKEPQRAIKFGVRERYVLLAVRRVFDVLQDTPFQEDVDSIVDKLMGGLPEAERAEQAGYLERFVYLPDGGTKLYGGKQDVIDAFFDGVLNRWRVRGHYVRADGHGSDVELEPYAMVLWRQGLYVIARRVEAGASVEGTVPTSRRARPAASGPVVYALERFTKAASDRRSKFEVPNDFRADAYFDGCFGIFRGGKPQKIVIDFAPEARHLVEARRWHPTQKLTGRPGGGLRLTMQVAEVTMVVPWVLGWGRLARVVEPEALREKLRGELAHLHRDYA